jgi:hypothetical protein
MSNRVVTEFEDDLETSFPSLDLPSGLLNSSMYQKVVVLERGHRYKLDLVIKDLNSNRAGVRRIAISPPVYNGEDLASSSMILSNQIQILERVPDADEMFVLGDVKILPSLSKEFEDGQKMGVYFQIYNLATDQSTLAPSVSAQFDIQRDGQLVARIIDSGSQSIQYFSSDRAVFIKEVSLAGFDAGKYNLRVKVSDQLAGKEIMLDDQFSIP